MNDFNAQNYFGNQMLDSVDYGNECGKKLVDMKLFHEKRCEAEKARDEELKGD
jgi:hypothetical protein